MRCKGSWQKLAERPARRLSFARDAHDDQLGRKLFQHLPADPTGWRGLLGFRRDRDSVELLNSMCHGSGYCTAFGTNSRRKRSVLDVATIPDTAITTEECRSYPKVRVRCVRSLHGSERPFAQRHDNTLVRGVGQLRVEHRITLHDQPPSTAGRNEVPRPRNEMRNHSATVAPRSEKVSRRPTLAGRTAPPKASSGTHSRAWSVEGVVGSLP